MQRGRLSGASYPIRTSSIVFWKYALTERSTVVSQLSKGVKTDLHIPDMEYPRFRCIFTFASSCSDGLTRTKLLTALAVKWFNKITYGFYLRNKNIEMLNHYNCVPIKFDIHHERIRFMDYFDGLLDQMEEVEKSARSSMRRRLKKECFLECTFRPVRRVLSKIKRVLIGH